MTAIYYKDKRYTFNNLNFLLTKYYIKLKSLKRASYRQLGIYLFIFILLIYLCKFIRNSLIFSRSDIIIEDDGIIDISGLNYKKSASSLIIDALVKKDDVDSKPVYSLVTEYINGIYFYNMNEPVESWWPFECVRTKMKHSVNTHVCLHDPKFDKYISAQLKENGLWEPTNVRSFLRQLNEVPDANVMDIGANIGLYSLLSAKLNRTVIAVEPLHDNLNRLHKAAQLESVQSKIIALVNALSNERTQLKVSIQDNNIGGSYVMRKELINPKQSFSMTSSSVIVNSILMDDLIDVYKVKMNKSKRTASKKFVIKLDIEGYEPFVFEKSEKLFKQLEIVAIFMEFGKMLEKLKLNEKEQEKAEETSKENGINYYTRIRNMLLLFKRYNYEPYEVNGFNRLDYDKWREWPWDIYLRQCDLVHCPDHFYKLGGV